MEYVDLTDEEYDALDEEMTRNPPKLGPNESDWLASGNCGFWGCRICRSITF